MAAPTPDKAPAVVVEQEAKRLTQATEAFADNHSLDRRRVALRERLLDLHPERGRALADGGRFDDRRIDFALRALDRLDDLASVWKKLNIASRAPLFSRHRQGVQ